MAKRKARRELPQNEWFVVDSKNVEDVRAALPVVRISRRPDEDPDPDGQLNPFDETYSKVLGVAEVRLVDHPERGKIAFVMYGDGIACMLHGETILWSCESMRSDTPAWVFECEEGDILGYDERGNPIGRGENDEA
jgi:hypothetical protein